MAALNDGFSTTIGFAANGSVKLYEKTVQPPGVAGGGAIDVSTMLNTAWRTRYPKSLKELGEIKLSAAYEPSSYTDIMALVNDNNLITITFPDGSTLAFWGWLDSFVPAANQEGQQPTAECTIIPSLLNDSGVETAPAYNAAP